MNYAFADTSFYMAFLNKRDSHHNHAAAVFEKIDAVIMTTDYVLLELGALMANKALRSVFSEFTGHIRNSPSTRIIRCSEDLFDNGMEMFESRPDKEWSLTDCISFLVMERHKITGALTYDHHFEQAGFDAIL